MISIKNISVFTLLFMGFFISHGQTLQDGVDYNVSCVGFYNLENLFDTLDTSGKRDEEFLPDGDRKWNSEKYYHKLNSLSSVLSEVGTEFTQDGLAVIGVSEIECKSVLDDLVKADPIKDRNYQVVHSESPDRRGIDVGLLYQPKYFELLSTKSFVVEIPNDTTFRTRNQLLVTGMFRGEKVHFVVVHWPSRSGGQKRSEHKRILAATTGRSIIDSLTLDDPSAKVIYMGDLNDDPGNKSVRRVMKAIELKEKIGSNSMYNPMYDMFKQGIGSLAWRDTWNLFDQMLFTPGYVDDDLSDWSYYTSRVYNKPYLCNKTGNYKGYPFRTYVGGAWVAGYSDHFPVYSVLVKESK